MTIDTNQDSSFKQKVDLFIEKNIRSKVRKLVLTLSVTNGTISFSAQTLAHLHVFAFSSFISGSIILSVVLHSLSLTINTYSLVNHFREKKLYKKYGLEKTNGENHKLQSIALNFLCDTLFLAAAVVFFTPISHITITIPLIVLGASVMSINIGKSIFHQVQKFKNDIVQSGEKKQLYKEEMKHYFTYRFIAHFSITLALSLWHTRVEKEKSMKTIEFLKAKDTSQDAVAQSYNPINEPSVQQSEVPCTPRENELAKSNFTAQHKNNNIQHQKQASQDVSAMNSVSIEQHNILKVQENTITHI